MWILKKENTQRICNVWVISAQVSKYTVALTNKSFSKKRTKVAKANYGNFESRAIKWLYSVNYSDVNATTALVADLGWWREKGVPAGIRKASKKQIGGRDMGKNLILYCRLGLKRRPQMQHCFSHILPECNNNGLSSYHFCRPIYPYS